MAVVAIKLKIMPEGLDVNLELLKATTTEKLTTLGGKNISSEEENIAFGLKAIILTFAWPEEKETSILETELGSLKGVSSAQIIDYRRAFG